MASSKLHAAPFVAGFGGVGPVTPLPDAWLVVFIDVETVEEVTDVELAALELLDHAGEIIAQTRAPWSVRRDAKASDEERKRDLSAFATEEFDGRLQPGATIRLRCEGALDTPLQAIMKARPSRYRLRIVASGDVEVLVEGRVQDPWPTAGPASPRGAPGS